MEPQAAGFSRVMLFSCIFTGNLHCREFLYRGGKSDGLFQKKSASQLAVSVRYGLVGKRYAGAYPERHVLKYFYRHCFGGNQRCDRSGAGDCFRSIGKEGRQHNHLADRSHWPSLARLIRAEVLQIKESPYIQIAEKLGKSKWYIARKHIIPQLLPQFIVGLILIFPHAILHESSVTFLGFGLSTEQPAIGIILSEAMKYLVTGKWWLALFPGIFLVVTVILFYVAGEGIRKLVDPSSVHE